MNWQGFGGTLLNKSDDFRESGMPEAWFARTPWSVEKRTSVRVGRWMRRPRYRYSNTPRIFSIGGSAAVMGTKERNLQPPPENVALEELIRKDNFYR